MSDVVKRRLLWVFLASATILVVLATLGIFGLFGLLLYASRPPISFSANTYQPAVSELCPGEMLVYTSTTTLLRAPAMPQIASTWYSADTGRTVVTERVPETVIILAPVPRTVSNPMRVPVPPLAPGHYEYRVAIRTGQIAAYAVPFTVPASCP